MGEVMMETILAEVIGRCRLAPAGGSTPRPGPGLKIRPTGGIWIRVEEV